MNKIIVYQIIEKTASGKFYFMNIDDANEWLLSPFCNFNKSYIKKLYTNNDKIINRAQKMSSIVNMKDWYNYA